MGAWDGMRCCRDEVPGEVQHCRREGALRKHHVPHPLPQLLRRLPVRLQEQRERLEERPAGPPSAPSRPLALHLTTPA